MYGMRNRHAPERGAVAVEFALILPALLLLLFGIIDFGRLMYVKNALVYASSDGARAAALHSDTGGGEQATVVAVASAAAQSMNIKSMSGQGTDVSVPTTPVTNFKLCPADTSTAVDSATAIVTASIPFKWFSPASLLPIVNNINSVSVTSTWLCVKTT